MTRKRRSDKPHRIPEWKLKKDRERADSPAFPTPSVSPEPKKVPPWPPRRRAIRPILLVAFLLGIVLVLLGVMLWESFQERDEQAAFTDRGVSTTATVVGVVRGEAELRFQTEEGGRVQVVVPGPYSHDDPRELMVRYLPEDPERAHRTDHPGTPWYLFPAVLAFLVVSGAGLGGYVLLRRLRGGHAPSSEAVRTRRPFGERAFWPLFVLFVGAVLLIPVGFVADMGLRYAALMDSRVVEATVLDAGRQGGSRGGCRGYVTVEYESHGLRYEDRIRVSCRDADGHRGQDTVAVEFGADRPDVVRLVGEPPIR